MKVKKVNNRLVNSLYSLDYLNSDNIAKLSKIFSPRTGIVNAILERQELSSYGLYMYQSLSANVTTLFGRKREVSSGGLGVGFSKEAAFWACMGETVERYCLSYYDVGDFTYKKFKDLPAKHRLDKFSFYSDEQYKRENSFNNPRTELVDWVQVNSYSEKGNWIYYPASLVYIPYENRNPAAETTSTGVSASTNLDEAIEKSILEIIERDSVMINFTMSLNPPAIDLTTIKDPTLVGLIRQIKKSYHIRTFKLYSDIKIPIYFSLIWRIRKDKLHYGIGACADLDSNIAIQKSLKECLFTYFYSKDIMDLRQEDASKIQGLYEHFLYYQDKELFKFLFPNPREVIYRREKVVFRDVLEELNKNDLEVFYKDLTTSDVVDTGIKIVRAIIPGMVDLNKTHVLLRQGAERFVTVPSKIGFKDKIEFNPLPHPFP